MTDSQGQHCPNCEAQAAEIEYWKTEARNVRRELKSEQKQTDSAMDNYDAMQRRCEAQAAEIEKLREELLDALSHCYNCSGDPHYIEEDEVTGDHLWTDCPVCRSARAALGETK